MVLNADRAAGQNEHHVCVNTSPTTYIWVHNKGKMSMVTQSKRKSFFTLASFWIYLVYRFFEKRTSGAMPEKVVC
jgi:hypothetical protein